MSIIVAFIFHAILLLPFFFFLKIFALLRCWKPEFNKKEVCNLFFFLPFSLFKVTYFPKVESGKFHLFYKCPTKLIHQLWEYDMNKNHSVCHIIILHVRQCTAFKFFSYDDQTSANAHTPPQWLVEPSLKWKFFFDRFCEYIFKLIFHWQFLIIHFDLKRTPSQKILENYGSVVIIFRSWY